MKRTCKRAAASNASFMLNVANSPSGSDGGSPCGRRHGERTNRCHSDRWDRSTCPYVVPCEPAEACAGDNVCSNGYTGMKCSKCMEGFSRQDGYCVEWLRGQPDDHDHVHRGWGRGHCGRRVLGRRGAAQDQHWRDLDRYRLLSDHRTLCVAADPVAANHALRCFRTCRSSRSISACSASSVVGSSRTRCGSSSLLVPLGVLGLLIGGVDAQRPAALLVQGAQAGQ